MSNDVVDEKLRKRVFRLLAKGPAQCEPAADGGKILLENDKGERIGVDAASLAALAREGLVSRDLRTVRLSPEGQAAARREASTTEAFQRQHRELDTVIIDTASGQHAALINLAESPLSQLVRRKTKAGDPFLSHDEFVAGERLRSDYTRGQIMPRMGANWVASVSSGKRGAGGGLVDLTDAAIAARQRVDMAIDAVGPELSGVLIDVCCFLKGLELVEAERGWPVRSAKVMLKSALGVLARHYNPGVGVRRDRKVLHWGAEDYRPRLG
ncbi:hypothetical protein J1C56_06900 [Aminobacter anthyllidis]|uniref:DUF6456 domain-containing protein n=1 Tax=Aminobacter anthyllidis TaxID=1035067 RepID=A0A9X1A8M3_9HYPH|nr:DUF6456 domain-containing protein [Aminobacter anthyllidis]MBT1155318.1 hypothetical protein [Aminobacter anthyllidis]